MFKEQKQIYLELTLCPDLTAGRALKRDSFVISTETKRPCSVTPPGTLAVLLSHVHTEKYNSCNCDSYSNTCFHSDKCRRLLTVSQILPLVFCVSESKHCWGNEGNYAKKLELINNRCPVSSKGFLTQGPPSLLPSLQSSSQRYCSI